MSINMSRSAGIFIDCVNQYYAIGHTFRGAKLSYAKYMERGLALAKTDLLRAFAYGVQLEDEATAFISALRISGYEPKYRQALIFDNRPDIRRTTWHVGMFADAMRLLDRMDVIIIGSSDPELIPMLDYIRERGVKVIILSCNIPDELHYHSDLCYEITEELLDQREIT